ncbi:hypothetical protein BTO20_16315 [Mycobacterium dioxanotrophicus]|uniref:Uncharacterized protein n=1 Tax=Mycobacterium dioxanotrophicus TaxID=482462 RepID=A0A1Y0C413_9MYCO|nr:hypothetical protein [Mycobacterium dioxanotrophicus]ART69931.1 hypothetical protein BTO20_16315 [Mycobacterium dioxanotrophicus]
MRETLLRKLPDGPLSARYASLGAQWHLLRLRLRVKPSSTEKALFDGLTVKLRDLSKQLNLRTTYLTEPYVKRVGDNRTFHCEPVPGVTGPLGILAPVEHWFGWVLGMEWHEIDPTH